MRVLFYKEGKYASRNVPEPLPFYFQELLCRQEDRSFEKRFDTFHLKWLVHRGDSEDFTWHEYHRQSCTCTVCQDKGKGLTEEEVFERACLWDLFDKAAF